MVHCESIDQARKSLYYNDQDFYNKLYSDLKEELLGMHSLHVVHRDIKPDNCMYNI
jgi:serine/threonine protein kinase